MSTIGTAPAPAPTATLPQTIPPPQPLVAQAATGANDFEWRGVDGFSYHDTQQFSSRDDAMKFYNGMIAKLEKAHGGAPGTEAYAYNGGTAVALNGGRAFTTNGGTAVANGSNTEADATNGGTALATGTGGGPAAAAADGLGSVANAMNTNGARIARANAENGAKVVASGSDPGSVALADGSGTTYKGNPLDPNRPADVQSVATQGAMLKATGRNGSQVHLQASGFGTIGGTALNGSTINAQGAFGAPVEGQPPKQVVLRANNGGVIAGDPNTPTTPAAPGTQDPATLLLPNQTLFGQADGANKPTWSNELPPA